MICKNCNMEHQSCNDMQEDLRTLRAWKRDALVSLADWQGLGDYLCLFFKLRVGDNIPKELRRQISATALVLRKLVNL